MENTKPARIASTWERIGKMNKCWNMNKGFILQKNMLILVKGDFPLSSGLRKWGVEIGNQDFGHYREVAHFKDPFMFINISRYRNLAVAIASRLVCIHHATGLLIPLGSCIIMGWRLDPNRTSTWNLFHWMLSSVKGCTYISTPISPEHLRRS